MIKPRAIVSCKDFYDMACLGFMLFSSFSPENQPMHKGFENYAISSACSRKKAGFKRKLFKRTSHSALKLSRLGKQIPSSVHN